jgi:hypothetical protein
MSTIRRIALIGACVLGSLALLGVPSAAAFPPIGTPVTGADDGRGIDFGGVTNCRLSLNGRVTGQETFGGGTIGVDRIAFTGCSSGATVSVNALPWTLGTAPTLASIFYVVDVNITTSRGTCRYSGDLLGYSNGIDTWFVTGPLFQRSAGCGAAEQLDTHVGVQPTDPDGNPVVQ